MIEVKSRAEMAAFVRSLQDSNQTIGFVPTMGALHEGHLSLIDMAKRQVDFVIASIFVNPTQFNNPDDLDNYPVTVIEDLKHLRSRGCDAVFLPSVDDMYPNGQKSDSYDFGPVAKNMEGEGRPGHFDGVGTIVSRLFDLIQPRVAVFGEKDFQQLQVIRELVRQKNYSIEILPAPISREESGLARSSRNERLSAKGRQEAASIYRALMDARNSQKTSWTELTDIINRSLSDSITLEYFALAQEDTLQTIEEIEPNKPTRAFIAVELEGVRLIDNLPMY